MKISVTTLLLLACVAATALALPRFSKDSLSVHLEDLSNGEVRFSVTNEGPLAARVLSYGLPLEGLFADMFLVTDSAGRVLPYNGPVARRVKPAPADAYVTVLPGNTVHVTVDLKEVYDFPATGLYNVQVRLAGHDSLATATFPEGELEVFVHTIQAQQEEDARAGDFTNCSNTEESQTNTAISGAITNSDNAYNCMNRGTCNSAVDTWFGAISSSTYEYDQDMFQRIYQYFNDGTPNYHCNPVGCPNNALEVHGKCWCLTKPVYAYVYPTDPSMTIYLCGAFWSQANERVNTLVHEESHFNAVGGTQDYVYGKPGCLALAQSNPLQASHNADNVCYFSSDV